jgi:hypothetical protein
MRSEAGSMGSVILRAVSPPEGSRGCFLWISRARSLPSGDAIGHGAGLGMTTLRPAQMQWVVVPSERSDSAASPEGARDLPLILGHFKCRFFGLRPRMTHQSQKGRVLPLFVILSAAGSMGSVFLRAVSPPISSPGGRGPAFDSEHSSADSPLRGCSTIGFALRMTHQCQEKGRYCPCLSS